MSGFQPPGWGRGYNGRPPYRQNTPFYHQGSQQQWAWNSQPRMHLTFGQQWQQQQQQHQGYRPVQPQGGFTHQYVQSPRPLLVSSSQPAYQPQPFQGTSQSRFNKPIQSITQIRTQGPRNYLGPQKNLSGKSGYPSKGHIKQEQNEERNVTTSTTSSSTSGTEKIEIKAQTGSTVYRCALCDGTFTTKELYKIHMDTKHQATPKGTSTASSSTCSVTSSVKDAHTISSVQAPLTGKKKGPAASVAQVLQRLQTDKDKPVKVSSAQLIADKIKRELLEDTIKVECGSHTALLCLKRLAATSRVYASNCAKCIYYNDCWHTPSTFIKMSIHVQISDWEDCIYHGNRTFKYLFENNIVTLDPPKCTCIKCKVIDQSEKKPSAEASDYTCHACGTTFGGLEEYFEHMEKGHSQEKQPPVKGSPPKPAAASMLLLNVPVKTESGNTPQKKNDKPLVGYELSPQTTPVKDTPEKKPTTPPEKDKCMSKDSSQRSTEADPKKAGGTSRRTSSGSSMDVETKPKGSSDRMIEVQCGKNKAWMSVSQLNDTANKSVFFNGRWITPATFAEESGFGWMHNWKLATKHHGASMMTLLDAKTITIAPPICRCSQCKKSESEESSVSGESDLDADLGLSDSDDDLQTVDACTLLPEEYKMRGPLWVLRVDCGPNTGWMCVSLLKQDGSGPQKKCILYQGNWLTPAEFVHTSIKGSPNAWKTAIRHHNKTLQVLLENEVITTSPAACYCNACKSSLMAQRYVCSFCSNTSSTEDTCLTHIVKEHPEEDIMDTYKPKAKDDEGSSPEIVQKKYKARVSQPSCGSDAESEECSVSNTPVIIEKDTRIAVSDSLQIDIDNRLINEYGEHPANKPKMIPVECGHMRGWLDVSTMLEGRTKTQGKMNIFSNGQWYSTHKFRKCGGKENILNWTEAVRHFNKPISTLVRNKLLRIPDRTCVCSACLGKMSIDEAMLKLKDSPQRPGRPRVVSESSQPSQKIPSPKPKIHKAPSQPRLSVSDAILRGYSYREEELKNTYGRRPIEEKFALPIECGSRKGWLCIDYIIKTDPLPTADCIFSNGEWFTYGNFKKAGGMEHRDDWKVAMTHFGLSLKGLMKNDVLTVSPPSCSCDECKLASGAIEELEVEEQTEQSVVTYQHAIDPAFGNSPPDGEVAFPVECGPLKAWLCPQYLDESLGHPEPLYYQGSWYRRSTFKNLGGFKHYGDWTVAVKHHGSTIRSLLNNGMMTINPPKCTCSGCTSGRQSTRSFSSPSSTKTPQPKRASYEDKPQPSTSTGHPSSATAEILVKRYGPRPPGEDFALPIECGSKKGWLCIQYFNLENPKITGKCIYSRGQWYGRNKFKIAAGFEHIPDWKQVIRHYGKTLFKLMSTDVVTVTPPSCSCDYCTGLIPLEGLGDKAMVSRPQQQSSPKPSKPASKSTSVITELVNFYGPKPSGKKFAIPITCGREKGWLCLEYMSDVDEEAYDDDCIYANGHWCSPGEFKDNGGYDQQGDWKLVIKHHMQPLRNLMLNGTLQLEPPTCRCNTCLSMVEEGTLSNPQTDPSTYGGSERFRKFANDAELLNEYGAFPPNEDVAFPVECGPLRGWLCTHYFNEENPQKTGECIYAHGMWYARGQFKNAGGQSAESNWKNAITHFGEKFVNLFSSNLVSINPPSCACARCGGQVSEEVLQVVQQRTQPRGRLSSHPKPRTAETNSLDDLEKTYGRRPHDEGYAIPVECGSVTGWLCLQFVNEERPQLTSDCVHSDGNWYNLHVFKAMGGKQDLVWHTAVTHFGNSIKNLQELEHLTITPPTCSCDTCKTLDWSMFCYKTAPAVQPTPAVSTSSSSSYGLRPSTSTSRYTPEYLTKTYGERPPEQGFVLPIECGQLRGWLCMDYLSGTSSRKVGECVYSRGKWYKRSGFKREAGYDGPHYYWQGVFKHFGTSYLNLLSKNVISINPPSCSCMHCSDESPSRPTVYQSAAYSNTGTSFIKPPRSIKAALLKLVPQYGEFPDGEEYALPIDCGEQRAWFCPQYVNEESPQMTRECVFYNGQWYTRGAFKSQCGSKRNLVFKDCAKHSGKTLRSLVNSGLLTYSPPSCRCDTCAEYQVVAASDSVDLIKEYGPKPPDGEFGLPITCGDLRGWLCLGYFNEEDPSNTGECVYSFGQWYTRHAFKNRGGFAHVNNWEVAFRHFGKSVRAHHAKGVVTYNPPSCSCDGCLHGGEGKPALVASSSVEQGPQIPGPSTKTTGTDLTKEYGPRPPNGEFGLPVACGDKRGWLCIGLFDQAHPQKTGECVYSNGEWYTRTNFKDLGGFSTLSSWDRALRHYGKSILSHSTKGNLTISPPSCKCDGCVHGKLPEESVIKVPQKVSNNLLQTYGVFPPEEEYALPIECGSETGWLCIQYIDEGNPFAAGECVWSRGKWYTRNGFKIKAGFISAESWKDALKHFGKTLRKLLGRNILTLSPASCKCQRCLENNPQTTTTPALKTPSDELVAIYGEFPPDETYALPIECGSKRGWLCLQYINEENPVATGECIYHEGRWYTRNAMKVHSGFISAESWKDCFRHFGTSLRSLLKRNTVKLAPASCSCEKCSGKIPAQVRKAIVTELNRRGPMDELAKTYGECPEDAGISLPIECGSLKGWLCLEYINEEKPLQTGYCIYSYESWYTRAAFKAKAGYTDSHYWQDVVKHHGVTCKTLIMKGVITISPPSCVCKYCSEPDTSSVASTSLYPQEVSSTRASTVQQQRTYSTPSSKNKFSLQNKDELVKTYGEYPLGEEYALPIECGLLKGWLCLQYINLENPSHTGECVYYNGSWYNRSGFLQEAGYKSGDYWQAYFKHHGKRIKSLILKEVLSLSPPLCRCNHCLGLELDRISVASTSLQSTESGPSGTPSVMQTRSTMKPSVSLKKIRDDLVKVYGEFPPDVDFALPIECRELCAWLCIQYIDQDNPHQTGQCVYYDGTWYTRNAFKVKAGHEPTANWNKVYKHFGISCMTLINNGVLTFSPPSCTCKRCLPSETDRMSLASVSVHSLESEPTKSEGMNTRIANAPTRQHINKLTKTYGEFPPNVDFALPVECQSLKGWMCIQFISEDRPSQISECIYFNNMWYTRNAFKLKAGYTQERNWFQVITHFGTSFYALQRDAVVNFSPPSCKCEFCPKSFNPPTVSTEQNPQQLMMDLLTEEYGERPPDGEFALPVECGDWRGWLCPSYINTANPRQTVECVYSSGQWYTRSGFKDEAGYVQTKNWEEAVKHFGCTIRSLRAIEILTFSPPCCQCEKCVLGIQSARTSTPRSRSELIQIYGDFPPEEDFALPIVCGPLKGWLCIQHLENPKQSGKCVYSNGKWYTRTAFKDKAGYTNQGNWMHYVKHFGRTYMHLINNRTIKLSPPSCKCEDCSLMEVEETPSVAAATPAQSVRIRASQIPESKPGTSKSEHLRQLELLYGEFPPGQSHALPVECGSMKGWMCLQRINLENPILTGKCVYAKGIWYTRGAFKVKAGYEQTSSWQQVFNHFGTTLQMLIQKEVITLSPPSCVCYKCSEATDLKKEEQRSLQDDADEEFPPTMAYNTENLIKVYGERPPDFDESTIPVEAAQIKGWFCMGLLNHDNPIKTGECIYSRGKWYTRNTFKELGMNQDSETSNHWEHGIKHLGNKIGWLKYHKLLTFSPQPSCRCEYCSGNMEEFPTIPGAAPKTKKPAEKPEVAMSPQMKAELIKVYGEAPPDGEFGLPIECGTVKGWLCLGLIDEKNPTKTGACIFSKGEWYCRCPFMKLGGLDYVGDWKKELKHFGESYISLRTNNIISISPPSCSCKGCNRFKSEARPARKTIPKYNRDELVKEYGEEPPGGEFAVPVECGDLRGWMCIGDPVSESRKTDECVYSNGVWCTRATFKNNGGYEHIGYWGAAVRHFGRSWQSLLSKNLITMSPPSCHCDGCTGEEVETITPRKRGRPRKASLETSHTSSAGKRTLGASDSYQQDVHEKYGEFPSGETYALPVECGRKKGWLCPRRMEDTSSSLVDCVYSQGEWYSITEFRKLGGKTFPGPWQNAIRHFDVTMSVLIRHGTLVLSPPSCSCETCLDEPAEEEDTGLEPPAKRLNTGRSTTHVRRNTGESSSYSRTVHDEYGEFPPNENFALPVECGQQKGWMCPQHIDDPSSPTAAFLYSQGEWYNLTDFRRIGRQYFPGTWQTAVRHFGSTILFLVRRGTLVFSPPSCSCDRCCSGEEWEESQRALPTSLMGSNSHTEKKTPTKVGDPLRPGAIYNSNLIKDYGEYPADALFAMPIECGTKKGWFCLERYNEEMASTSRECIYSYGTWCTIAAFKKFGGHENVSNWQIAIRHFGQTFLMLLRHEQVSFASPSCLCGVCQGYGKAIVPKPTEISSKLGAGYGEPPDEGGPAIPVECGPLKGWMCLGYMDGGNPLGPGVCILSNGQWYGRSKFKDAGGFISHQNWRIAVTHHGIKFDKLINHGIFTMNPASCSCEYCSGEKDYEGPEDATTPAKLSPIPTAESTVSLRAPSASASMPAGSRPTPPTKYSPVNFHVYGEPPPGEDCLLPIECGPKRGWLCLERMNNITRQAPQGSTGPPVPQECIFSHGQWFTRAQFRDAGGKREFADWRLAITHHCIALNKLYASKVLTRYPPACQCHHCIEHDTTANAAFTMGDSTASDTDVRRSMDTFDSSKDNDDDNYEDNDDYNIPDEEDQHLMSPQRDEPDEVSIVAKYKHEPQLAIKVDCMDSSAWMCICLLAPKGERTEECIIFAKKLLAPMDFVKQCGFTIGNWKIKLKHFGESINGLQSSNTLKMDPPACSCDVCEKVPSTSQRYVCLQCYETFASHSVCQDHMTSEHPTLAAITSDPANQLSQSQLAPFTYHSEEYPYAPEFAIPVECGQSRAWLFVGLIERFRGVTEECIFFNRELILPSQFLQMSGDDIAADSSQWKNSVTHHGKSLTDLIKDGTLTITPPYCRCRVCEADVSIAGQIYFCSQCYERFSSKKGCERHMKENHQVGQPPEGEFAIPIECGHYKAWMCVGRIKEKFVEERTGPCILFNGQWIAPSQLACISGEDVQAWRTTICHSGKTLQYLLESHTVTISPPACHCKKCTKTVEATKRRATSPVGDVDDHTPAKRRLITPSTPSDDVLDIRLGVTPPASTLLPNESYERPDIGVTISDLSEEEILAKLIEREAIHICVCGNVFRDRVLFYLHRGMHSSDDQYKCSFCSYVAPNWYEFNSHVYEHSPSG